MLKLGLWMLEARPGGPGGHGTPTTSPCSLVVVERMEARAALCVSKDVEIHKGIRGRVH